MHWKHIAGPVLATLFVFAIVPAPAQVTYAAKEGKLPLTVGVGLSDYSLDWGGSRRMMGITAWVDYRFHLPGLLNGLGVEAEGRDLNFDRPSDLTRLRQDVGLGGVNYQWRHRDRIRPYGKFLVGFGSIDFPDRRNPYYTHDTRTVLASGGGVDFRVWRNVAVRADYEYQFWRQLFGPNDLNPNGVTVGAVYDFGWHSK